MANAQHGTGLNKLGSEELRRLAAEADGGEAVSVIAQLNLPPQQVEISPAEQGGARAFLPGRVAPESAEERRIFEDRVAAARAFLSELLGGEPRFLATSRAFVLDVTGAQLREIAASDLFKAVQPNRRLG